MRMVRFMSRLISLLGSVIASGALLYILMRQRQSAFPLDAPATVSPSKTETPRPVANRAEEAVRADREDRAVRSADGTKKRGRPSKPRDTRIDLNKATAAQLEALPRIGAALAQRIIDNRDANGNFESIEDLRRVSGIGASVLDAIKDRIKV